MKKWFLMMVSALSFSAQAAYIEVSAADDTLAVGESTTISVLTSLSESEILGSFGASIYFSDSAFMVDESSIASTLPNDEDNVFDAFAFADVIDFNFFSFFGVMGDYTLLTFDVEAMEAGTFSFDALFESFWDLNDMDIEFDENSILSASVMVTDAVDAVDGKQVVTASNRQCRQGWDGNGVAHGGLLAAPFAAIFTYFSYVEPVWIDFVGNGLRLLPGRKPRQPARHVGLVGSVIVAEAPLQAFLLNQRKVDAVGDKEEHQPGNQRPRPER